MATAQQKSYDIELLGFTLSVVALIAPFICLNQQDPYAVNTIKWTINTAGFVAEPASYWFRYQYFLGFQISQALMTTLKH